MATEYKRHLKKGTIRAMANKLPMPKTTGVGDTECKQRFEDQHVTVNPDEVTCSKCLNKLANLAARKF